MTHYHIIHLPEVTSTNLWLRNKATGALPSITSTTSITPITSTTSITPTLLLADFQSSGRGCGTNTWESERGKNLTFSLLLHPTDLPANRQFHLSEAVSVALCKTLDAFLQQSDIHEEVSIKWPNDIYVGNKKISGILIENTLQGHVICDSIIGIGLNVNQTHFVSDAPNPISLKLLTGHDSDLMELLNHFLQQLDDALYNKTTSSTYRERLFWRSGKHRFESESTCFSAEITGVTDDGRLSLLDEQGHTRLFSFKEVKFII